MSERGRKGKVARKRQGIVPPRAPKKRACPECNDVGDFYISCHKCGARFKRSELQGALISFGGLAAESDDICPICGEWHCLGGNSERR